MGELIDMHCSACDWDGYTDEPDGPCPGCGEYEVLYKNDSQLYGEPGNEDDYLCETHGCRLTIRAGKYICLECVEEEKQAKIDEWKDEVERYEKANPFPPDKRAGCKVVRGKGFSAFSCTMPWWA